jgi:hypothetical protein
MKKIFLLLAFSLSLLIFIGFKNSNDSNDNILVGKWKLDATYSPDFSKKVDSIVIFQKVDEFTKQLLKKNDPGFDLNKLTDSVTAYMNDIEKEEVKEFKADGSFIFTSITNKTSKKGKWKLNLDKVKNRNYNSIILDYNRKDYLKYLVIPHEVNVLKNNHKLLDKNKIMHFTFIKLTKDTIISRRYVTDLNKNGYEYLNDVYLKQK